MAGRHTKGPVPTPPSEAGRPPHHTTPHATTGLGVLVHAVVSALFFFLGKADDDCEGDVQPELSEHPSISYKLAQDIATEPPTSCPRQTHNSAI